MPTSDSATLPAVSAEAATSTSPGHRRAAGVALFVIFALLYFSVGAVMILRYNFFDQDGPSRAANAGYALLSRQPHLSAIGFAWNPLPSVSMMPFLMLSRWWPELRTAGLASVAQSAMFMAGSVLMVRRTALDRNLRTGWRWLAIAAFGLNPVIVIYGAAGMSEAAEVFCVLWATRYLLLWVGSREVGHLAGVGIALAVGYLARYEVALSAAAIIFLVVVVTMATRSPTTGTPSQRTNLNALIAGFPITVAVVVWALSGWVTTGDLFAALSSNYGNSGYIAAARARGVVTRNSGNSDLMVITSRILAMQPFAGIAVAVGATVSMLGRRLDTVVPIVTCGPVLSFAAWGQFSGATFGWFRFYILAVPLVVMVALACWQPSQAGRRPLGPTAWATNVGAALLITAVLAFPVTARAMLNPSIGNQHLQYGWRSLVDPDAYPLEQQWYRQLRADDRLVSDFLDDKRLPHGSVLMDTFVGWSIWLYSADPELFVVTSDYDFPAALNRPWDNDIRYIAVSNPALNDAPDAINLRYPTLWSDGAGIGVLVYSAVGPTGVERWRVYEVVPPPADGIG